MFCVPGVELCKGAMEEAGGSTHNCHTIASSIADLTVIEFCFCPLQENSITDYIMYDAVGHCVFLQLVFIVVVLFVFVLFVNGYDAIIATMDVAVVECVVVARGIEPDAFPLSVETVVGQIGKESVGAVASHDDGVFEGSVAHKCAIDPQSCTLMETEGGAFVDGEGDSGIDHETVVDDQWTCGCEGGVGLDGYIAHGDDVLTVCLEEYTTGDSVGERK